MSVEWKQGETDGTYVSISAEVGEFSLHVSELDDGCHWVVHDGFGEFAGCEGTTSSAKAAAIACAQRLPGGEVVR